MFKIGNSLTRPDSRAQFARAPFLWQRTTKRAVPIHFDKENITKTCLRLLLVHRRELKHYILASQATVHRCERVQLILQRRRIFRVKDPTAALSTAHHQAVDVTYTFSNFDPSTETRVLFPTISVGKTRSSRIFSCTDVSVRERGLFCLVRELRVGLLSIRR